MAHLRVESYVWSRQEYEHSCRTKEPNQVSMAEMATPSSASSSDKLLSRIAILLFILVAGLLTVFGYYASSICITVVLAGFLAILFDPLVVKLERLHTPLSVAAAGNRLVCVKEQRILSPRGLVHERTLLSG